MRLQKGATLLSVGVLACAHPARSQSDTSFDSLQLPGSPMVCREVTLTSVDSAAVGLEVWDAHGPVERRIYFAYDSVGAPVYATTSSTAAFGEGDGWAELSVIRFTPVPRGTRARKVFSTAAAVDSTRGVAGTPVVAMTAEELSRGQTLAAWLWAHRCGRNSKGKGEAKRPRVVQSDA